MFFFFFFLITDLYVSIPAFIAKNFNPITEFVIRRGIPIKEIEAEMETHPAVVGAKIRRCSV